MFSRECYEDLGYKIRVCDCGSNDQNVMLTDCLDWFVLCKACGKRTGYFFMDDEAIDAWNNGELEEYE